MSSRSIAPIRGLALTAVARFALGATAGCDLVKSAAGESSGGGKGAAGKARSCPLSYIDTEISELGGRQAYRVEFTSKEDTPCVLTGTLNNLVFHGSSGKPARLPIDTSSAGSDKVVVDPDHDTALRITTGTGNSGMDTIVFDLPAAAISGSVRLDWPGGDVSGPIEVGPVKSIS